VGGKKAGSAPPASSKLLARSVKPKKKKKEGIQKKRGPSSTREASGKVRRIKGTGNEKP